MFICRQKCFYSETGNLFQIGMRVETVPPGLEEFFEDLSAKSAEPWAKETSPAEEETIEAVKAKLTELDITFHPKTGIAKLKEKLDAALEDKE